MKLNSKLIHGGVDGDELTGAVNVPIYHQKVGITDNLIRLSVGIEDSLDIVDDLQNALQKSKKEN